MIVNKNYEGARLDRFISEELNLPHSLSSKLIRKGKIRVNNKKSQINSRLQEGDELTIPENIKITPKEGRKGDNFVSNEMLTNFTNSIIFENEDFFAINKPSGLATQGGSKVKLSVDDFILQLNPEFRLVHRLDKETSGVLLIAKNKKSATNIANDFALKNIVKKYFAITKGVPNKMEGSINSSLLKQKESIILSAEGKKSLTHYKVLQYNKNYALIEVVIETGRMHQIRAHLQSINCYIVGDLKYGDGDTSSLEAKSVLPKMLLHANSIKYKNYNIVAPLPLYFKDFINNFLS